MNLPATGVKNDCPALLAAIAEVSIPMYAIVRPISSTKNNASMQVALADSSTNSTCSGPLYIAVRGAEYNTGSRAQVELSSFARKIAVDTSARTVGDPVYLGTSGALVYTPGTIRRQIGVVERAHATEGVIRLDTSINFKAATEASYSNGTSVTNTVTETALGTKSFAASELKKGRYRITWHGYTGNSNATDTLTIKAKLGATTLFTSTAVDQANGDVYFGDLTLIVRADPSAASAIVVTGLASDPDAPISPKVIVVPAANYATNGALDFVVTATWSVAHANNQTGLLSFTFEQLD
jgi:hypothetical protein